jgi:hypothetical protein
MTIKERFLKNLENQETEKELRRKAYVKQLGEKINAALLDPEFIDKATKALIEHGAIQLTDIGCKCQAGGCSDQKGFTNYVKEAFNYWNEQDVIVQFGIDSYLYVKGAPGERLMYPRKIRLYNNK